MSTQLFKHTYIDNKEDKTLVLFHGTGGDENDFLFLNDQLSNSYNVLGIRGNIDENGLNRFFKRKAEGVFDELSIKEESGKIYTFTTSWMKEHEMNIDQLVFLGFSNGANILLATLFYYPKLIRNSVLLRPMVPFKPTQKIDLSENTILLNYGTNDQMIPEEQSIELIELLRSFSAQVTFKSYSTGHQLSSEEIADVIAFITA